MIIHAEILFLIIQILDINIYPTPLHKQGLFFKWSLTSLNSVFFLLNLLLEQG